jgi:outer membrane protein TolC
MNNYKTTLILLAVLFSSTAASSQTDSLFHYLNTAVENNPGVRAAFLTYRAAMQKIPQAGAWQDPQLELSFFLQPMEIIDGKQTGEVKLMQMFPWFGTGKEAKKEMHHMAQMAYEQFRETRNQLWLDVYTQWYVICRLRQQIINLEENKKWLSQLETLALQRFTTASGSAMPSGERQKMQGGGKPAGNAMTGMNMGGSPSMPAGTAEQASIAPPARGNMGEGGASSGMADILRIQLEIVELENEIESLSANSQAEKAKFNALLNRPPTNSICVPDTFKQLPFLFDEATIRSQISLRNPMLAMIAEEEAAYRAKAKMDRKMSYPMLGLGLQYMPINKKPLQQVDGHSQASTTSAMSGMNGKDMIMPMIAVSIPIYREKYKAQQRENTLLLQTSREKYSDMLNLLEAELYRLKSDLDNAERKITLYRKQSELATIACNLTVSEFASGRGSLSNLISIQRQLLDYKLKTAEAIADYNIKAAAVQKLIASNEE